MKPSMQEIKDAKILLNNWIDRAIAVDEKLVDLIAITSAINNEISGVDKLKGDYEDIESSFKQLQDYIEHCIKQIEDNKQKKDALNKLILYLLDSCNFAERYKKASNNADELLKSLMLKII